ncbi:unnamed protein product, partial [Owenia fusiformis]
YLCKESRYDTQISHPEDKISLNSTQSQEHTINKNKGRNLRGKGSATNKDLEGAFEAKSSTSPKSTSNHSQAISVNLVQFMAYHSHLVHWCLTNVSFKSFVQSSYINCCNKKVISPQSKVCLIHNHCQHTITIILHLQIMIVLYPQ